MKTKLLILISILSVNISFNYAQTEELNTPTDSTEMMDSDSTETLNSDSTELEPIVEKTVSEPVAENTKKPFHQILKSKFIEGGAGFMGIVLLTLILGLALCLERIIYLHAAGSTNNDDLLESINGVINQADGIEKAKEICRNTRGPVASIFYQGLERSKNGIDAVEKSITSYGSVQMGMLERGTTWISLFIALAPMLGFMGTVIGMIGAFDAIETAGDISPSLVAGGIKVALLTTVFGLIVAIILQIFYNYIISKIDDIVNRMEDASISLIDMLSKK
jgi:biopolymer transport protein ExbB